MSVLDGANNMAKPGVIDHVVAVAEAFREGHGESYSLLQLYVNELVERISEKDAEALTYMAEHLQSMMERAAISYKLKVYSHE